MSNSGVQEVYVYDGMRLVPETRLLLWAAKLAAAEAVARECKAQYHARRDALIAAEARIRGLEERAGMLTEVLYAIQWSQTDGYEMTCPECDQAQKDRHAPDCRIGMVLAPPPEAEKRGEGE